jgi:hypothetical protein
MSDKFDAAIEREEQNAAKEAADENRHELRKEEEEEENDDDSDDEVVVKSPSKPERPLATPTAKSNDNVKKEAPEMNTQLQR